MKSMRRKFIRRLLIKIQMETEEKSIETKVGAMHKRREKMADGERYIIFYTFGDEKLEIENEVKENV